MHKHQWRGYVRGALLVAVAFGCVSYSPVSWAESSSTNYEATELQFGSSTLDESCSGQYCARASIGDLAMGRSEAPGSTAEFGTITSDEPLLEVIVDRGDSDLGVLTTERTATKTMTVKVRNYLSSGYILQIVGDPPRYEDYVLQTPTNPTVSSAGTEQFGINLADNTLPDVGAAPAQVPSEDVSFGQTTSDYRNANQFKYISGDIVARSPRESGQTDYTISMIVNVSNGTPSGHFSGDFSAIVTPVF